LKYLSVCSGIEAATVAWHPLGWQPAAFSEIEPFPSSVLAHHYPSVPNLGDMTKFKNWSSYDINVLVGGTPCQSFSVAGLRKGLADPRGNLMLTYLAIADRYQPEWLVWENVPGVLSSNGGKDFGTFLGGLAELGYGFAYRVRDAQHFGVPQRRRRVFVVGCLGGRRRAAAVLFERHSVSGHPAPRRQTGQTITPTIRSGASNGGAGHGARSGDSKDELIVPVTTHTLRGEGFDASEDGTGRGTPLVPVAYGIRTANTSSNGWGIQEESTHTLDRAMGLAIAFNLRGRDGGAQLEIDPTGMANIRAASGGSSRTMVATPAIGWSEELTASIELAGTMQRGGAGGRHDGVMQPDMQVRRLTPMECERLQGFPDSYTLVPHRGKPAADGPRYKALGNSMAVPCMHWIGSRIKMVDEMEITA
jgi:DNA (cytosine-5)-methyltransferase 1